MTKTTFIYVLNDPRDGRIRYVGKADNPYRRWQSHIANAGTNDHRGRWITSLLALGLKPELEILEEIPRAGWQEIEKEYIRVFRMVNMKLTNCTDGGDGVSGAIRSEETRAKQSAALRGRVFSPEHCANISRGLKGHLTSPEHRLKISVFQRGRKKSLEHRAKISAGNMGRIVSPETRAIMSAARKGVKRRPHSPETREKIRRSSMGNKSNLGKSPSPETREKLRIASTGRKHSPEARAKISAARRAYFLESQALQ